MGLDYSYTLWVPEAELWPLLDSVAELSKPCEPLKVTLLDGQVKQWPFSSFYDEEGQFHSSSTPVHSLNISRMGNLYLATSIYFSLDTPLRDYGAEWQEDVRRDGDREWQLPIDERGRLAVGYIYISVQLAKENRSTSDVESDCICVNFTAATTGMSRLFTESESIQQTFLNLTQQHHGFCCFLDQEGAGTVLWLDGQRMETFIPASPESLDELRALVSANAPDSESGR